jgi:hypothetical protein
VFTRSLAIIALLALISSPPDALRRRFEAAAAWACGRLVLSLLGPGLDWRGLRARWLSVVTQCGQRIDRRRATRGRIAGKRSRRQQGERRPREAHRVERLDPEEQGRKYRVRPAAQISAITTPRVTVAAAWLTANHIT